MRTLSHRVFVFFILMIFCMAAGACSKGDRPAGSHTVAEQTINEERFVSNIKVVRADRSTIEKLTVAKARMRTTHFPEGKEGSRTLEEAAEFLLTNVAMACPPGACVEHDGVFYFSGGRSTKRVTDFSSGFAIEKGKNEMYTWGDDVTW